MTRHRFNQANRSTERWHHQSTNNLKQSKARGLFLEDYDNVDMKDNHKNTYVQPPIDQQDVV